ncbi:hypothetical protein JKP88DRAFT_289984 [Tribonema minus]|uniref:Chromo domain-containing protein n=1 Tax=Tribonema minus TaxID=303371 RepID=A0A835Z274_9STRA|nr:hypothetical protein JKP88DRAFT_289984 [Tribonema minus]
MTAQVLKCYSSVRQALSGASRVLAVGPSVFGDKPVQSGALVIDMKEGPTRVTRHLVKLCRDPTDDSEGPPGTLPAGFARYLLAKHWHGRSPGSLTADDVTADPERHGVEAVLRHRLVAEARGRGQRLQYLVRWEGDVANSWEDASNMDACPTALHEYWTTLSRAADLRDDFAIDGAGTGVVRKELRKAEKQRGIGGVLAVCGRGSYELAPGAHVVMSAPSSSILLSTAVRVRDAIAEYVKQSDRGIKESTWCNYVSEVHLALAAANDPLHEHFNYPQLRRDRGLAWRTDLSNKITKGPFRHDPDKLRRLLDDCAQAVTTLDMSRDMLSVAIQVVTGARHVEVVSPIHQWTLLDDGSGVRYNEAVKAKPFTPEGKAAAAETPKVRSCQTLVPAQLVLRALEHVRREARPGDTTVNCQARIVNAICPRAPGAARKAANGRYALFRELIDGYNAWYGLEGLRKKKIGIFRQVYNCFQVMEGAIPDTVAAAAASLGHRPPPLHVTEAYRLVRPAMGLAPLEDGCESADSSDSHVALPMGMRSGGQLDLPVAKRGSPHTADSRTAEALRIAMDALEAIAACLKEV